MKKVAVVILNYKVRDFTLRCLASVKNSTYKELEIIVVDNNSEDNIEKGLKDLNVSFIQTGKNLGYTGGNNLGIKKAIELGADYVFVLNPDTIIDKNAIDILVTANQQNDDAILGPKILFEDKKKIWYAGGIFDNLNVIGKHRGVNEVDKGQYDKLEETDYVTGAAFFIPQIIIKKVGLFDEKYFLYYEDSDFSFRVKKAGFKIFFVPEAKVYHANAQSTGLGSPIQDYFITRNRMYFASKFLPVRTQFALFRESLKNLGNPMRRLALFDFLIGNLKEGSIRI